MSTEEESSAAKIDPFNLLNFKVQYSNNETPDVLQWVAQTFDEEAKANYTWWLAEYQYDDLIKGNQPFMTSNLVSGWMRNIDKARKNAFCSACVLCDKDNEANQTIKMVWITKGKELPKELTEQEMDIPMNENCKFRILNYNIAEEKKIIEDMLLWSDEIMGMKFLSGTIFK